MMQAVVITAHGGPDVLVVQPRPVPQPGDGEVLIRVAAAGINRPDIFQRKGHYPAPPGVVPDVPGLEVAGTVESCGRNVERFSPGDRVCALVAGGGYAEYVVADARHCLSVPDGVGLVEAACLPETVFTVWHNVFQRGRLQPGERLLVHGGAGGIGSTAIKLAAHWGADVYATAGTAAKCLFCEQLGAVRCINYRATDFAAELAGIAMHVILDSIGAPYFERHMGLLAEEGRLIQLNAMGGRKATIDLLTVMQKRVTVTGSTLRARDPAFKAALREDVERQVWPLVATGTLRPVIHQTFSLADAGRAHALLESGDVMGKLALICSRS